MEESADGLQGASEDEDEGRADRKAESKSAEGPDPVIGAGLALFGIFAMGLGGARDSHVVFDTGMFVAVGGAVLFVLFVALSAMKLRAAAKSSEG